MTLTDLSRPTSRVGDGAVSLPGPSAPAPDPSAKAPSGSIDSFEPGTTVELRSSFDRHWTKGFEVIRLSSEGYRLRRLSDGEDLPGFFPPDDVRKERRKGTWWY